MCSWVRRLEFITISFLSNVTYTFNIVSVAKISSRANIPLMLLNLNRTEKLVGGEITTIVVTTLHACFDATGCLTLQSCQYFNLSSTVPAASTDSICEDCLQS